MTKIATFIILTTNAIYDQIVFIQSQNLYLLLLILIKFHFSPYLIVDC